MEAKGGEAVGDEIRAPEAEGLEQCETERRPWPGERGHGQLQRAEANRAAGARPGDVGEVSHPIDGRRDARRAPHGRRQSIAPKNGRLPNYSTACCRASDRIWPSTH